MMEGRPADDNIEGWYEAASHCDENRIANIAFHSSSQLTSYTHTPLAQVRLPTILVHQAVIPPDLTPDLDLDTLIPVGVVTEEAEVCEVETGEEIMDVSDLALS